MSTVVEQARTFAIAAHSACGQVRKYTGEPYHVHPAEVAWIVEQAGGTEAQRAAAWLHDVVEDTDVSIELIEQMFGTYVAELVGWLTDVSKPEDGNRAERKAIDREHTAQASLDAKMIKLADLISNTSSIVEHDEKFAKVYLAEKRLLLTEALYDADAQLLAKAWSQVKLED
jgi:(p)ppGpp synthase/HD superfamily hydrolase